VVENESAKTTETESQEAVPAAPSDLDKSKPDVSEPEQEANIGSPIDIDADSNDMSLFLNFMYLIDKLSGYVDPSSITIDLDEARAIWLLADEYDCAEMIVALRHRLAALARQQPWAVLELASGLDDMDLARVAIASMTEKHLHDATKGDAAGSTMWPQLSKLRLEWQLGFLRLVLPITASVYYPKNPQIIGGGSGPSRIYAVIEFDFKTIAQKFDPYLSLGA